MTFKITKKIIKELNDDPITFITSYDSNLILNIITYATDKYFNNQPIISDEIYDFLYDTMKDFYPENLVLKKNRSKNNKNKN
jgi:NAD-dependent DNA ligase